MSIIKRRSVHVEHAGSAACGPAPAGAPRPARPGPAARLLRAGGVVRAIEVTCACGEVTVIELEHAPDETQRPA